MNKKVEKLLFEGAFIPANPLVLTENLELDEFRQRRLIRYYLASGVTGLAVGVHTTQFEIRDPEVNLLEPVLKMASDEVEKAELNSPIIKVAGICGTTTQALNEAKIAVNLGYDLGLVSLGGLDFAEDQLIEHIEEISKIIPVFGFYLQPAVGGRRLSFNFWRQLTEIKNVKAIKAAPFDRYATLDVVRAVAESSRKEDIALYTGNDDNIVADLLAEYKFKVKDKEIKKGFVGGLLGHWSVWTHKSVDLFKKIKKCKENHYQSAQDLLELGHAVTDTNAAIFDPHNSFRGSIAGIHEVLRRQGLMKGRWTINPKEQLSPGQIREIDRVIEQYPQLTDDKFVQAFLKQDSKKHPCNH